MNVDDDDDVDDDETIGPALPGMKGFREASAEVEAQMRDMEEEEKQRWQELRNGPSATTSTSSTGLQREEWMLSLPTDQTLNAALGGLGDQAPRKFRARDKDERDESWFASPAARDQAKREQAQMYEDSSRLSGF